jgi:O-antigen/teichoic acid export membrane protein
MTSAMTDIKQKVYPIRADGEDKPIWRRFRRNVSISAAGSVLALVAKLAQTAFLTKVLPIGDYGRVLLVLNFFVFMDSFFGLRVGDLMFRFFPLFKEQEEAQSVRGLLALCLGLCLASGIVIYGAVAILSPYLADRFYPDLGLTPLLRIYGCTILFSSLSGVYEPVLRLYDHFTGVVAPQVLGALITLGLLGLYFVTHRGADHPPSIEIVIVIFAVGALIQSVPPFLKALRLLRPFLSKAKIQDVQEVLAKHRRPIIACLMNVNVTGYLKFAISPGDIFLLGLFSTPIQVAWYGLAKQLSAPLALLQTNILTAVTPEISVMVATRRFAQLNGLLNRYVIQSLIVGSLLLASVMLFGRFMILHLLSSEYAAALPIFYLLTIAGWLMLAQLVFHPVALNLDMIRWHNLALLLASSVVVVFILLGRLDAMTMAYIHLADVFLLRILFGVIVTRRLRSLAAEA